MVILLNGTGGISLYPSSPNPLFLLPLNHHLFPKKILKVCTKMVGNFFARPDGSIRQKPSSKISRSEEKLEDRIKERHERQDAKRRPFPPKHRNFIEKVNLCVLIVILMIVVGAITVTFFAKPTYAQAAQDKISSEIFNSSYTQLEKELWNNDGKMVAFAREGMRELWEQISNQSFDSWLQTFFDMVDEDAGGRITEEEVRESITFGTSADQLSNIQKQAEKYARLIMEELNPEEHSYIMIITLGNPANKLSNIQKQTEKYARLIMEELDPEELGYITMENLEMILLQGTNLSHIRVWESKTLSQTLSRKLKPASAGSPNLSQMLSQKLKHTSDDSALKKGYRATKYFYRPIGREFRW